MDITINIYSSLNQVSQEEYHRLHSHRKGTVFYDWRFLLAAETSPLLAVKKTYYLAAYSHGRLLALLPVYLQDLAVVDPFKRLAEHADIYDQGNDTGLFSHIMHCYDSMIPSRQASIELHAALFNRLRELAEEEGARYFGLLNVRDPDLRQHADALGLNVNFMLDRWYIDLTEFDDFEHFVEKLPADGRREMRRQLRKFDPNRCTLSMLAPPFDQRLEQLTDLCHQTTARLGTPQYFPAEPLSRFSRLCGDLIRLSLVEQQGQLVGGVICFEQEETLHIWSAGMRYDLVEFSPYTLAFAQAYRYAFENGFTRVEGGRLNEKIKTRLGFRPEPLYAITSDRLNPATVQ
ncbi:GNAT family N-acetyltransferase [Serratia nevei]|uniref:GNAT family N-acetyltransferase n=1 Tax=Serratia nevei TaxID=2703794 RepID=UPI00209D55D2|nr:GNAT family N-acetyltransferase [Serratia nevei]MCP1107562.1 GNAT family N-acetyltransferase [Serratia nevei]